MRPIGSSAPHLGGSPSAANANTDSYWSVTAASVMLRRKAASEQLGRPLRSQLRRTAPDLARFESQPDSAAQRSVAVPRVS